MKNRWLIILLTIALLGGCEGSKNIKEDNERVLYVLSEVASLQTIKESSGDCSILYDAFIVHWNELGCVIIYKNGTEEENLQLYVDQKKDIEIYAIPSNLKYEFYLTYENNKLPDSWNKLFVENEQKQQKKEQLGSKEKYVRSRNSETELKIIEDAFIKAGLKQDAKQWYQLFLDETWSHGDVSIVIIDAKANKRTTTDSVNLVLIDGDGNEMTFYGFTSDYVDMIVYKGEIYAGPYTG